MSCTYPLTCFCVVVEDPATVNGRKGRLGPCNHTSVGQGPEEPSCLPECRRIPWRRCSHQEPAGMDFSTDWWIRSNLWVSFLTSSAIISNQIIRIRSNLYGIGTIPLLGTDKEFKKVKILVDITCNDELLKKNHPGHNPIYPCWPWSIYQASLDIDRAIGQEVKSKFKLQRHGIVVCWVYDGLGDRSIVLKLFKLYLWRPDFMLFPRESPEFS